jgi:hypothetical protein
MTSMNTEEGSDSELTLADQGRQAWDSTIERMMAAVMAEYSEEVTEDDVIGYLRDELELADPEDDGEDGEDGGFGFDSEEELLRYIFELDSVTADDVYDHVFGQPSSEDETGSGDEDSDEEDEGGPVLMIAEADEPDEVALDPYYSSDEDEEPANRAEFDFVLAVARAADTGLENYQKSLPNEQDMFKQITLMVFKISKFKRDKKTASFPRQFFPIQFAQPTDWPAFCHAMARAKRVDWKVKPTTQPTPARRTTRMRGVKPTILTSLVTQPAAKQLKPPPRKRVAKGAAKPPKPQKPTVYEFSFPIWDKATCWEVPFRGRQLKTPDNKPGRSWPQIALALDDLARQFGQVFAASAQQDALENVGTRALGTAILFILAGRGNEVRKALIGAGFKNFPAAESVILEFITLAYGIEGARLSFAQLDTVLQLANIASGARFRAASGTGGRRHTFLNVYSWVRTFPEGPEHVYVEGIYTYNAKGEKQRELTQYQGFTRAKLLQSLQKKMASESSGGELTSKSGKSVGKSLYSHSAAHVKVIKLLKGDKPVTAALWQQVRHVSDAQRRQVHADRFGVMGPIRLYNLIAGVLHSQREAIGNKSAQQVAADLIEAFGCFFAGQRPAAGNAFRDFLPMSSGASFDGLVTIIRQQEGVQQAGGDALGVVCFVLADNTAERLKALDDLWAKAPSQVAAAVAELVRKRFSHRGQPALHLAARTGRPWLVRLALDAGADVTAENDQGETAQAFAGKAADGEIAKALSAAQQRQRGSQPAAIPQAWSAFFDKTKPAADWLTDADVRRLLLATNLANTEVMPAVDIFTAPDALATFIRDNYLGQLAAGQVRQYTVVPINFSSRHWATLVIVQNPARRSQPGLYFFDSLGASEAKRQLVLTMLRATGVYINATALTDLSASLQTDGYTCGSWLVFAATRIVTALAAGQGIAAISAALAGFAATAKATHTTNLASRTA